MNIKSSNFASRKLRMVVEETKYFKQFDIKFSTLGIGLHEFVLNIDKTFFLKHANDEIKDADIQICLTVHKSETMAVFDFDLKGTLIVSCDICLEDLTYPIHIKEELILKTSQEHRESEDENIAYVNPNEHQYNVELFLYEVLYASLPMRKTHPEMNQTCNDIMIQYLEKSSQSTKPEIDPRWEALKEIHL